MVLKQNLHVLVQNILERLILLSNCSRAKNNERTEAPLQCLVPE